MKLPPVLSAIAVIGLTAAQAGVLNDLSSDDQARVKSGRQIMTSEPLDGYPWPRVRVYQTVNASPREVMAIFFDYDNAKNFVPNCEKSAISKKINARTFEVDYLVNVPILPDEAYTVLNELSGSSDCLRVDWRVLRATSIKESEGELVVEPLGRGSVLRYTNLVKPGSRAAGLLKGIALGQMKDTVNAIVNQVVLAKRTGMAEQMSRLEEALSE